MFQDTPCRWKVLSPSRSLVLSTKSRAVCFSLRLIPVKCFSFSLSLSFFLFQTSTSDHIRLSFSPPPPPSTTTTTLSLLLHSCTGASPPVSLVKKKKERGSTYRACLLEVSVFCRRSLHNNTYSGEKSLNLARRRRVLVEGGMHERRESVGVVRREDRAVIMTLLL